MKKILLADDDASVRETLGRVLSDDHFEVIYAATGRQAAAKFMEEKPQLVLLDLKMPGRDGWDVFDLMNSTRPWVPVIIITANPQQYVHATKLGVDAIMEKPLDIPLLLEAMRVLLIHAETEHNWRLAQPNFKTMILGHHS